MALVDRWRGAFGDEYAERNPASPSAVADAVAALAPIWQHLRPRPSSVLEVGPNRGRNLLALAQFAGATLYGVEPNASALQELRANPFLNGENLYEGDLSRLPLPDSSVDMTFTSGVLIHVREEDLPKAYEEMFRVTRRHILCIEYFASEPTAVPYQGHTDMLFKRDFGSLWLDWFAMEPVAEGFLWSRTTGQDDLNWWLFRKP